MTIANALQSFLTFLKEIADEAATTHSAGVVMGGPFSWVEVHRETSPGTLDKRTISCDALNNERPATLDSARSRPSAFDKQDFC